MLIWILALILFAIAGACGYKLGAVRFGVSLAGLILAAALALPLGPYLQPLVARLGLTNPIWAVVVPPLIVFLIIYAIFVGISFFVHRKVELHYKYNASDSDRFGWERVNRALGLLVGLMVGAVWLFLFGLAIYVADYFTVQMASDETKSPVVRFLNQARLDLQQTGLDKAVAPFDPMPPRYYEASDILGLVYQNPILASRISQYPPFLLLADRPEMQELAKDAEFTQLLLSKGDLMEIFKHPRLQAILQNQEIVQELLAQDLQDLRAYLETGVSPKYEEERILGKWRLDSYATMAQERKRRPDMSSTEMRRLRLVMTEIMPAVSVTATTDNKISVNAEGVAERLRQLFQPPASAPAAQAPDGATPSMSPQLAQRYGLRGQPAPGQIPPPAAAAPKPVQIPYMILSAQGSWQRAADGYQVQLQDEQGRNHTLQAAADEDRLTLISPNAVLAFTKAD